MPLLGRFKSSGIAAAIELLLTSNCSAFAGAIQVLFKRATSMRQSRLQSDLLRGAIDSLQK